MKSNSKARKGRKRGRKCRMCGHSMSKHRRNIAGAIICTADNCSLWLYCGRKEKQL